LGGFATYVRGRSGAGKREIERAERRERRKRT
jgi:hypothetical protein